MRWLLLAFLAAASGLLTFTAREPPRTRAAVRRSARERLVLPEPRPAPHGETAEATEPAPPEEEGRGFARLRPCRVRVVTGANSQPVPGARAWGMRLVGDELDVRRSTSDSRGELVLPDSFAILVRKTGYVPHFDSDLDEMPREVRLRPGLPLRGRVILHGGAPVAGARVYAWDAASDAELVGADFDQGDPCSTGFTPTDQDGCFEIDGVAGEFILCIVAAGFGVYRARHQPAPEMLVALGRGGVVEGHVFDDKGRPVAEARVYVEQEDGGYDFGAVTSTRASAHTKSGPDGMYRIVGLPPARYVVTASKGFRARGDSRPVQLAYGACAYRCVTLERCAGLQVRSGHAHRWLRCRLLKPDGSPARSRFWCDSYTLGPGFFKREGIPAGSYDLHISATWDGPRIVRRIELRPGETLRLSVRLP